MSAGQLRAVQVDGVDLQFASIDELDARIELTKQKLLAIESGVLAQDPRSTEGWRLVERYAVELRDLSIALQIWVAEEEEALDREIEAAREFIRALNTFNPIS